MNGLAAVLAIIKTMDETAVTIKITAITRKLAHMRRGVGIGGGPMSWGRMRTRWISSLGKGFHRKNDHQKTEDKAESHFMLLARIKDIGINAKRIPLVHCIFLRK
jgi:hypothetical protein